MRGRAYGSYRVKNPREERVLGYDAQTLNDASVSLIPQQGMWNG